MGKEVKYKESTIRKVLNGFDLTLTIDDFIASMNKEVEIEKVEENRLKEENRVKKEEEDSKICVELIIDDLVEGENLKTRLVKYLTKEIYYKDAFSDKNFPDEGETIDDFVMVGNKLYKIKIHCSAQWYGDWSLRCNLPDEISVTETTKIKDFEVIDGDKEKGYINVKLK